jgi:hypothetical protein
MLKIDQITTVIRQILLFAAILGIYSGISQAQTTPESLVQNLYKAAKTKYVASMSKAELRKYFEVSLADKFWKVAHGEGGIDFDILYNTQDVTDIRNFRVGKFAAATATTGSVLVSFVNSGRHQKLDFKMSKSAGTWKIADIKYGNDFTLLKTLSEY